MYLCVYVSVCLIICMSPSLCQQVCMYPCLYICVSECVSGYVHGHVYASLYLDLYLCVCILLSLHVYAWICLCICVPVFLSPPKPLLSLCIYNVRMCLHICAPPYASPMCLYICPHVCVRACWCLGPSQDSGIGFWIGAKRARGSHDGTCMFEQWKWVDSYGRALSSIAGLTAFIPGKPDKSVLGHFIKTGSVSFHWCLYMHVCMAVCVCALYCIVLYVRWFPNMVDKTHPCKELE